MELEIVPEPDEATRKAILAALAEEEDKAYREPSAWARQLLPGREDEA